VNNINQTNDLAANGASPNVEADQCDARRRPVMSFATMAMSKARPVDSITTTEPKPPLVVVVDDDPAVCGSLKFSLELEGFSVRTYGSGPELLHNHDWKACKCFVVDQRMPAMSGMELIAKLRDEKILTPAILIISHPSAALSARAATAGVPIVEKPLLNNSLVDRIREACQQENA
jgi:two-component system, LuxR family, response regulator FixJ